MGQYIDIVFDGPPSVVSGRFVEVEDEHGASISVGEWLEVPYNCPDCTRSGECAGDDAPHEPFWHLRIPMDTELTSIAEIIHGISTSKGFAQPSMENLPQKLMLSVSELSEAMEEHRKERGLVWYGENGKPEGILPELADSIIRNLHMMHSLLLEHNAIAHSQGKEPQHWTVGGIIREKVDFNNGRPHMHGRNIY